MTTTTSRATELLFRQLKDVQVQADRVLKGDDSAESIEQFARYSKELKKYALDKFKGTPAEQTLNQLPEIHFQRNRLEWYHFVLFSWISLMARQNQARLKSLEEIREARNKYASLEFVIRDMLG